MNGIVAFWTIAVLVRWGVSWSLTFNTTWLLNSPYNYILFPVYYSLAEIWPLSFTMYKLIFSEKNFRLHGQSNQVVSTGYELAFGKVTVVKLGRTLCALKKTTIHEIEILQQLKHPSIISYVDHQEVLYGNSVVLRVLLEYVPSIPQEMPTLTNFVRQGYSISQKDKSLRLIDLVQIAVKICDGMMYLHSCHIAHLDLKVRMSILLILEGR